MQTFLPYSNFKKTAQVLDNKRLGKQRVEAWQIYQTLMQGEYKECPICNGISYKLDVPCNKCHGNGRIKTAWYNHPIVKMWKGYEKALLWYGMIICNEWSDRGYKDNMFYKFIDEYNLNWKRKCFIYPKWLGNKDVHASHRSNLLRKDKKYYSQFGWTEPDNLSYVWIKKKK